MTSALLRDLEGSKSFQEVRFILLPCACQLLVQIFHDGMKIQRRQSSGEWALESVLPGLQAQNEKKLKVLQTLLLLSERVVDLRLFCPFTMHLVEQAVVDPTLLALLPLHMCLAIPGAVIDIHAIH